MRPLLRGGCDDIWVIADAEGYRASLLERRSMRVGQEYRLIPAAMPNGVLHAKCIYLYNDQEDLLLVGSGNLTFGGHGKNAEVFEALVPEETAQAFADFAGFLESLGTRPDVRLARREWIDEFSARAHRAALRGSNLQPVRLLHSLDSSVADQLPASFAGLGPCHRVLVMSPYHDHDGEAVERLLQEIDATECAIGITPEKSTPFPFEAAASWDRPVAAVTLEIPERRFIHAKWYEFEFAEHRLLLTGSINATRKALTSIDNAELGVLRTLPLTPAPLDWKVADEPGFQPMMRMPSGLGTQEVVYAAFDRSDAQRLTGQLISAQPASGRWQLRLVQADGESFSGQANLDEEGRFTVDDPDFEDLSAHAAVQISLSRDEREARGWVHNEMLLSVGARRRLTAGALSRIMRREGTDDDLQALLDYLSISAGQHLHIFDRPMSKDQGDETSEDDGRDIVSVHIDELAPSSESTAAQRAGYASGLLNEDQFNAAMLRIRRILLGQGRSRLQSLSSRSNEALEEDLQSGSARTPEQLRQELGLDDFEDAVTGMIAEAEGRQEIINRLLVLLLEVSMWMRLTRLSDLDGAHDFLTSWFFKACRLGHCDETRTTAIQQHVITGSATLYLLASDPAVRQSLGTALHDALEKFYRGPVPWEHALGRLFPDPQAGFGTLLLGEDNAPDYSGALRDILSIVTRRQQLDKALNLAAAQRPVPRDWEIFSTDIGAELWARLNRPDWNKRVKRGYPGATACAFCYMTFPFYEAGQLKRQRFTRCIHCKKFTVDTAP